MLAATRGDGREGEDVTQNVMTRGAVQGLPVTLPAAAGDRALPEEFEVRGEVYIRLSDFEKVGHGAVIMLSLCCLHAVNMTAVLRQQKVVILLQAAAAEALTICLFLVGSRYCKL